MADIVFASPRFAGNAVLQDCLNGRATLQFGSTGDAVRLVQQALIDLGESIPSGATSGYYAETQAAVTHYQTIHGLSQIDGIVGQNTMAQLDTDIVAFDAGTISPPPPPPPPVLTSIRFWIKAFIPDTSLTPYVYPAPGASAGQTMIVVQAPGKRCFLGDNRGYSDDPTASARIHSLTDIVNLDQLVPELANTDIHCGLSIEIDPSTGVVINTGTAATDRVQFLNLRANQTVGPNGGVIDDSPSPLFVQLDYDAAANLPLLAGSPDIDMFGTLQIDRENLTFRFQGAVDGFPAFEAYVCFNGGAPINVFVMPPIAPFELIGDANRKVDATIPIVLA